MFTATGKLRLLSSWLLQLVEDCKLFFAARHSFFRRLQLLLELRVLVAELVDELLLLAVRLQHAATREAVV